MCIIKIKGFKELNILQYNRYLARRIVLFKLIERTEIKKIQCVSKKRKNQSNYIFKLFTKAIRKFCLPRRIVLFKLIERTKKKTACK